MPTIQIHGIPVELSAEAATFAQQWSDPLDAGAATLLQAAAQADPRIKPALDPAKLGPLLQGLVAYLMDATGLVQAADPGGPLGTVVQSLVGRYLGGATDALGRLVQDWASLGPIFFTRGTGPARLQYQLDGLASFEPLDGTLELGGSPALRFHLSLRAASSGGEDPGPLDGSLVYLPRDLERDWALTGDTTHLCAAGGDYAFSDPPCAHPWCRSAAERLAAALGDPASLPTYTVWPAAPGSGMGPGTEGAYGYRQDLGTGTPQDLQVASDKAPEASAFYRTLGRQLALAYAFSTGWDAQSFTIHRRRPYWTGLAFAFQGPMGSLGDTGAFTSGSGPLAAPPAQPPPGWTPFGLQVAGQGGGAPTPLRASAFSRDVALGCQEAMEALGGLAEELGQRLCYGPALLTWYRPRPAAQSGSRSGGLLDLLSAVSSWGDWDALDQALAAWRQEDEAAWTAAWFPPLVAQVQTAMGAAERLYPAEALAPLSQVRDQVLASTGAAGLQQVTPALLGTLSPLDREAAWEGLQALSGLLGGLQGAPAPGPWPEGSWRALPTFALLPFELADHSRARYPHFVHALQDAALWSEAGEAVPLAPENAPPPRLQRGDYFPEPVALVLSRQLASLANAGARIRLAAAIPSAMAG